MKKGNVYILKKLRDTWAIFRNGYVIAIDYNKSVLEDAFCYSRIRKVSVEDALDVVATPYTLVFD